MIAKKRLCKFFDRCRFVDEKSRACTVDVGDNYCSVYRTLARLQKEKGR